jgi:hypothetical protein
MFGKKAFSVERSVFGVSSQGKIGYRDKTFQDFVPRMNQIMQILFI